MVNNVTMTPSLRITAKQLQKLSKSKLEEIQSGGPYFDVETVKACLRGKSYQLATAKIRAALGQWPGDNYGNALSTYGMSHEEIINTIIEAILEYENSLYCKLSSDSDFFLSDAHIISQFVYYSKDRDKDVKVNLYIKFHYDARNGVVLMISFHDSTQSEVETT